MWIVLFVVLLDIIGFGILVPIFPFYAARMGAGPEMVMFYIALYMAAAFVSAPILGRLSDSYGRKPVMAISLVGAVVGYLMLAFAANLWVVALSRILSGLMAGNFSAAQAYIVDRTDDDNRAQYMGYFSAALALGYVIGPAIGSALGGTTFEDANFTGAALVAAAMSALALFAVIFWVKEDRSGINDRQELESVQPSLVDAIKTLAGQRLLVKVIACALLYNLAGGLYETIFPLWAERLSVIDGPRDMLPMLLGSGLIYVAVQAVLIAPLTKRYSERLLLVWASLGLALANYAMTVAGSEASALAVTVCMILTAGFAGVIIPVTQIVVSRLAAEHERGMVFGVMGSLGTLGRTIATVGSGVLFGQVHVHSPYFVAVFIAVLLILLARTLPDKLSAKVNQA